MSLPTLTVPSAAGVTVEVLNGTFLVELQEDRQKNIANGNNADLKLFNKAGFIKPILSQIEEISAFRRSRCCACLPNIMNFVKIGSTSFGKD